MWLLSNIKLIAYAAVIIGLFGSGWTTHSWYANSKIEKEKTKVIKKLGEGQNEIIKFNMALDKELANAKDDKCIDAAIPDGIRMQLR